MSEKTGIEGAAGAAPASSPKRKSLAPVGYWLYCVAGLVFAMVIVGGATRLTDSGLSITEWKPLLGAIPPLSEADWDEVFAKYKQIPQYREINAGMTLAEFKFIYWWEWGHRQLGRFIGLAYALPLLIFLALKRIPRRLVPGLVFIFILGGLQGFLGWYMVRSGLVERVDVSQYRLAAHLGLAVLIYALLVWVALGLRRRPATVGSWDSAWLEGIPIWLRFNVLVLIALIFLQIVAGAFVAGLNAGLAHNTWPLMDGRLVPEGLLIMQPWWLNGFENAMTVQFNHRVLAYGILLLSALNALLVWRNVGDAARVRLASGLLLAGVLAQSALGIWTLLQGVPLWLALAHQGGAIVLFTLALWHGHVVFRAPVPAD